MKKGKKAVIITVISLLVLFLFVNLFWFIWRGNKFGTYSKEMGKTDFATWMVPRYGFTDAEGFDYGVKYPGYLSTTGNLSVSVPANSGIDPNTFMIIWPKPFGTYEYGVSLVVDQQAYQIYINPDGTAVDPEYSDIVEQGQDIVDLLLEKADEMWDLQS